MKSIGDEPTYGDGHGALALKTGDRIRDHHVIRLIEQGGMGQVCEVEHETFARRYALKLLPEDLASQMMPMYFGSMNRAARQMASELGRGNSGTTS